jgi:hypothetical protein
MYTQVWYSKALQSKPISILRQFKQYFLAGCGSTYLPAIPATWEAEVGGSQVQEQLRKGRGETLYQKSILTKELGA